MNRNAFESLESRKLMAITASFAAESSTLTVLGDDLVNEIVISRDPTGYILVNDGTVPVAGGIPTMANTTKVIIQGMAGSDVIRLDETNGALPSSELHGGEGFDTITGGSAFDLILGEAGLDSMMGMGGGDLIMGGDGSDTLVGGAGVDSLLGENLNDMFIWNAGDESDIFEGGDGFDTTVVNGEDVAESFTLTANGTRVRFDRLNAGAFNLDMGTMEFFVLEARGGDDTFSAIGNLTSLLVPTI